jgi:ubiquinone/menaquinone biosynthesis C-methylase UbiE
VSAKGQAALIAATSAGLLTSSVVSLARGRHASAAAAGAANAVIVTTVAWYLRTTRIGKFQAWARILNELRLRGDETLLDLGCGRGAVLLAAAKRLPRGRAVGVDLWRADQTGNSQQVTLANAALEGVADRVEVQTADVTDLPFDDDSVDVIVSNLVIHNIPGRAGRQQAVAEAARVLRPGGRLAIADIGFTRQYARQLRELNWPDVRRRNLGWRMWWGGPWLATHLVTATKPDRSSRIERA